jgi:hypothetical protein
MALGPDFMRLLRKAESRHYGWSRQALIDLVEAVGEAAAVTE